MCGRGRDLRWCQSSLAPVPTSDEGREGEAPPRSWPPNQRFQWVLREEASPALAGLGADGWRAQQGGPTV